MSITVSLIEGPPDVVTDEFAVATNEDWVRSYQITRNGVPVAFEAGWKVYMQMVSDTGSVGLTASLDNRQFIITDTATGAFALQIRMSETSQVVPGSYLYDIVLVAGEGTYRLVKGKVTVEQGITTVPGTEKWTHVPLIARP
jgi:hypothetical protein